MIIGVPKEIKEGAEQSSFNARGVHSLIYDGHTVIIEMKVALAVALQMKSMLKKVQR